MNPTEMFWIWNLFALNQGELQKSDTASPFKRNWCCKTYINFKIGTSVSKRVHDGLFSNVNTSHL